MATGVRLYSKPAAQLKPGLRFSYRWIGPKPNLRPADRDDQLIFTSGLVGVTIAGRSVAPHPWRDTQTPLPSTASRRDPRYPASETHLAGVSALFPAFHRENF